jgi:hypothetical protein
LQLIALHAVPPLGVVSAICIGDSQAIRLPTTIFDGDVNVAKTQEDHG